MKANLLDLLVGVNIGLVISLPVALAIFVWRDRIFDAVYSAFSWWWRQISEPFRC